MADYKFIFKLTPNNRDVIINTDVLLNGYPEVEYPIPFVQTNQLGYVIDPETFKFVDPSLIPYMEGPYPARLEIEYSTTQSLLSFYAENNKKLFNGFDLQFDYNFNRLRVPEWHEADDKTYDYMDFTAFIFTKDTDPETIWEMSSTVFKINFRFKLFWGDDKSHSTEINFNEIIPSLSIFPFVLRITLQVNPEVIDSLDNFKYQDIGEEPPILDSREPTLETIMVDVQPYLSYNYDIDIENAETIINYLLATSSSYAQLSDNIERVNYIKLYLKKYINDTAVDFCKNLLQHPHVLTYPYYYEPARNHITLSLYQDTDRQFTCTYNNIIPVTDPETGQITYSVEESTVSTPAYNTWVYLPDSRDLFVRDLLAFKVEATFTHPTTFLSVNAMGNYILQQKAYPGDRTGYIKMKYMDDFPLEVWSPYINVVYGKSKRDEANVKVNKNLNTEYLGFIIDSSFSTTKDNYQYAKLYRKNILSATFIDPNSDSNELIDVSAGNINYFVELARNNSSFYNTYVNIIGIHDISIGDYFVGDNVFSDYDRKIFADRWNTCKQISVSTNLQQLYCLQIPKEQQEIFDYGLWDDENSTYVNTDLEFVIDNSIGGHMVSYSGAYTAVYAKYKIQNTSYFQIIQEEHYSNNLSDPVIYVKLTAADDLNDYDITLYSFNTRNPYINNVNSSVLVEIDQNNAQAGGLYNAPRGNNQGYQGGAQIPHIVTTINKRYELTDDYENINNYKIVPTEEGNSTQYKFCVNNLLYDGPIKQKVNDVDTFVDVQVPRFGVYGIYFGLFAYNFDIYNYETLDIPYINMTGEDENIIIRPDDDITDINKYIIDKNMHVSGAVTDTPVIIPNTTNIQHQSGIYGAAPKKVKLNNMILGATSDVTIIGPKSYYDLFIMNIKPELNKALFVNGAKVTVGAASVKYNQQSNIKPWIFAIHLNEEYTLSNTFLLDTSLVDQFYTGEIEQYINPQGDTDYREISIKTPYHAHLLLTNGENEKHFETFENKGQDIDTGLDSYMLIRTNPKLTGNVKLVVDTDYNIYLDTFKASPRLNDQRYRKQGVPADGNYPYDIKRVFATLPNSELFKVPENSLKAHKVYNDFNDQYETMYEYGAETNTDNLYSENMKILAPLHIGKDVPDFFTIFRYDEPIDLGTFNDSNYTDINKFKDLLDKAETVMTYDLRLYTSIGQYLNNYKDMLTNYGQCYLQFIEEDNYRQSATYRQGTNIWKGISINRGILTNQSETSYFAEKILSSENSNKQELFNNFIMQGFERNNLLYPNIINLEFMFNDNSQDEYSMHRYFGLYLTENDFIKYGYIIPDQATNRLKKYDRDGNPYIGDVNIYHDIFKPQYSSRLFYAVTNDLADRVKSETDVNNFLSENIKNKPEKNMLNIKSDLLEFDESDKSFITLHFNEPLNYGEHIKLIAMNKPLYFQVYNDLGTEVVERTVPSVEHIVFEIISSNNEELKYMDNYISPIETINDCRYSENTTFHRIAFYSQDLSYPDVSATLTEQIERIAACIKKFKSFIKVGSYNNKSISIFSEHSEMYLQHIAAHDFDDFSYDYFRVRDNNFNASTIMITTNKRYTESIDFIPHRNIIGVNHYPQITDEENDWIKGDTRYITQNSSWYSYVEVSDPTNIKDDSISYFNAFERYKMHALTNQSDYFDGYYAAFSNYGFESIGWRYNTIVKFMSVSDLKNTYTLYDDQVYNFIKQVKYPIAMTDDNMYETIQLFNISNGYLRNNIIDPDIYERYTSAQQFIFDTKEFQIISSPYNVNYSMLMTIGDALLKNNQIQLYKPKYANIAIMGISNVKDIDTIVNSEKTIHRETRLTVYCQANEILYIDESDYRLQHGVMYQLINGQLVINDKIMYPVSNFIILPNNETTYMIYFENVNSETGEKEVLVEYAEKILAKTDSEIKINDRQIYQDYNYTTNIPQIQIKNLFRDPEDINHSELLYPINPLVNCNWKSNGQYLDYNNVLDVSNISQEYDFVGSFVENTYTPAVYEQNQYITNKIDNVVFIDDKPVTYRDAILKNKIQHPIKHLLIDNVNIDTAIAYYNSNIQSLEFIFSGVKFEIKLNSKLVNTFIHLDAYDNYEVFVINDYNISKRNELFISQVERFILLINHRFYIDYAHEAVNNIKTINDDSLVPWQQYSVVRAPYAMNMKCSDRDIGTIFGFTFRKSMHESLMSAIDPHNLWNSLFIQFDIPKLVKDYELNDTIFVQSGYKSIYEYGNYMALDNELDDNEVGYLSWNAISNITHFIDAVIAGNDDPGPLYTVTDIKGTSFSKELIHFFPFKTYKVLPRFQTRIPFLYGESYPFVITKADGDYNKLSKQLLRQINLKITKLSKDATNIIEQITGTELVVNTSTGQNTGPLGVNRPSPRTPHYSNSNLLDIYGLKQEFNIMTMRHIDDEDINLTPNQNLFISYKDQSAFVMNRLSDILGTPIFLLLADEFTSNSYKNYYIPKPYLKKLQDYIEVLLVKETNYEKLKRYTKSVNDDVDVYIITKDSGVKYIQNSEYYNPLIFKLSIPNMIKYNYGWFTPNTNRMLEFSVDDELTKVLKVDLLQANTNVTDVNYIENYTGNKVFDDNRLYTLDQNYFLIPKKSLLETTWDVMHYRKYTDEDNFVYQAGHVTGIDDKSFFGSRCMVMRNEYILLDTWEYSTANDILTYQITDSNYNVESNNTSNTEITINVTAAIFNHFINNNAFAENWVYFDNTQYTGMKNYIKNTLSSYYNMNSNIEVIVYAKDIEPHTPINILTLKPSDLHNYNVITGINVSEPDLKEDFYTITIKVPFIEGKNIYPNIKIYKK